MAGAGARLVVVKHSNKFCLFKWEGTGMNRVCPGELGRQEPRRERNHC